MHWFTDLVVCGLRNTMVKKYNEYKSSKAWYKNEGNKTEYKIQWPTVTWTTRIEYSEWN